MGTELPFQAARSRLRTAFSKLSTPLRIALIAAIFLLATLALVWLANQIAVYFLARSYVEQVARTLDLNVHLAKAVTWIAFAVTAILGAYAFSVNRQKRVVGLGGILVLLVAHSAVLWLGTSTHFFDREGAPIKCYVVTRDSVRYGERVGTDPITGRPCRPMTPEIAERLQAYEKGAKPQRLAEDEPTFFSPRTGEAVIWYSRDRQGRIELFDLMGFHPESGDELSPVISNIVAEWKQQRQRETQRPPQRVDLHTFSPFDPKTGQPRVWHRVAPNGDYEFFDREGFDSDTGERLILITPQIVANWRKRQEEAAAAKCYLITREGVSYGSQAGLDPTTGRQCRPVTAEIMPRLVEYEKGRRPERIAIENPAFFDLRSGEAAIWYYKDQNGKIELFDLMGFHPETGDELQPITKNVATLWKQQVHEQDAKPPELIDIQTYAPFDSKTGNSRVWYWRGPQGEYKFYNRDGFDPATGDRLKVLTKDAIEQWLLEAKAAKRKRDEEQAQRDAAEAARVQREEKERQTRAALEAVAQRERLDREGAASEIARKCDQLAGNPTDPRRASEGASYAALRNQAKEAIQACEVAVRQSPAELRFQYQLARATQIIDRPRAFGLQKKLVQQQYPAAFDNAAWLHITEENNYGEAIKLFRRGVQLGDPDCMASLAELLQKGRAFPQDQSEAPIELYRRAAQMGHTGAARAIQEEEAKALQAEQDRVRREDDARRMIELFGAIVQGMSRR